ncbi:MAG: tetratricopeptide repeat protein [Terracidiphilus sp.]
MNAKLKRFDLQPYLSREPVTLALLTGLAILLFAAVTGLSSLYHRQQASLAERWSSRGAEELKAKSYAAAVVDYRAALLYSRDDYTYQLGLAEALVGERRVDEAYAYLINLWDRRPENGMVNLELARIQAARGLTDGALRYYHNAIYAIWPGDQELESRNVQLELIHLLLKIGDKAQADSELIALAANLGSHPQDHTEAGELFLQAQDNQRALEQFRMALEGNQHPDVAAMAGAGNAAFALGEYLAAEQYLRRAVGGGDKACASQLKLAELVLHMDPFRAHLKAAERRRIIMDAFTAGGIRLKACSAPGPLSVPTAELTALAQKWTELKPRIDNRTLSRNPDLGNNAMSLVFNVERETSGMCGGMTDTDNALLLIANLHEGL